MKILVINGPNMNMLGIRQPEIYGHATYEDLKSMIAGEAERLGAEVSFFQSNQRARWWTPSSRRTSTGWTA